MDPEEAREIEGSSWGRDRSVILTFVVLDAENRRAGE
jgi:hypothetical protein